MARYGCTITVETGKMSATQTGFVWIATADNFPTEAIDGGATSILNGGGNLRCYTDTSKSTQIPIHIMEFVTGVSPSVLIWGRSPSLGVGGTVYIEADEVATTQPSVTDPYGRNAVYTDLILNYQGYDLTDSTGNESNLTAFNSASAGATGYLGEAYDVTGTGELISSSSLNTNLTNTDHVSLSMWVYRLSDNTSSNFDEVYLEIRDGSDGFDLGLDIDQVLTLYTVGGNTSSRSGGSTIPLNQWVKLDIQWSQTGNYVDHYVNGLLDGTRTTLTDKSSFTSGSSNLYVSTNIADNTTGLNGYIQNISFSKNAKSSNYLLDEYTNQSDPSTFWNTSTWEDQDAGGTTPVTTIFSTQTSLLESVSTTFTNDIQLTTNVSEIFSTSVPLLSSTERNFSLDFSLNSSISEVFTNQLQLLESFNQGFSVVNSFNSNISTVFSLEATFVESLSEVFTVEYSLLGSVSEIFNNQVTLLSTTSNVFLNSLVLNESISDTFNMEFELLSSTTVTKDFDIRITLLQSVDNVFTASSQLISSLTQQFDISSQLRSSITDTLVTEFSLNNNISSNFTIDYSLVGQTSNTFTLEFRLNSNEDINVPVRLVIIPYNNTIITITQDNNTISVPNENNIITID